MGRLRGWWLLVIAAALGAVVSFLASSMPVLIGSVLVGGASAIAGALTVRAERTIDRDSAAPPHPALRRGKPIRVSDLRDPFQLGVHLAPPLSMPDGRVDRLAPYVRRDLSSELEEALGQSRFVLVIGESTAGKSRAAYEAMRKRLPDHAFIRPAGKQDLPEALALAMRQRRCVVWLDELDRYLGVDGLTAEVLGPLFAEADRHRVVLATMRSHERAQYSPRNGSGLSGNDLQAHRQAGDVLKLAREIRIERLWSAEERARASASVNDWRIHHALEQADRYGVSQFLAAGPQLFQDWQDARGSWPEGRPRGAALVNAAVDLRRAGLQEPVPISFLYEIHELYLPPAVRVESWDEALAWATEPLHSTSSLLVPVELDRYLAFDYLADAYDTTLGWPAVPDDVWQAVTAHVRSADAIGIAWTAYFRNDIHAAERALRRAFDAGRYDAALEFATMMHSMHQSQEVVDWLEQAVSRAEQTGSSAEETIALRNQLAWWIGARYSASGDPAKALELAQTAVEESERLLGTDHEQTWRCRQTLARQFGALGRIDEALAMAERMVGEGTHLFGADHHIAFSGRFEVAVWTRRGGDPRRAIALWQTLVVDELRVYRELGDSLDNIDATLDDVADPALDAALTVWLSQLIDQSTLFEHLDDSSAMRLLSTLAWWIGGRQKGDGDYVAAREIAQEVVNSGQEALGAGAAEVLRAKAVLAHQIGRSGDHETAKQMCEQAAEDAARIYGELAMITYFTRNLARRWSAPD
ncbi:tetratricopeptide repeat protein [Nonomuraea fuscirosea]|uniref:tetratricopeptide repeat protein n=1 Tax=Nonomuraea fuscirosea TaxID=1291556 RepID=UPI0034410395